ncbi:MAG TPA: NAD(P)-dependent alcohol dehydrogenase [bacterium]
MKAIVTDRYGSPDVLRLEEVPTPVPKPGQVLVKVHAAAANPADWHLLRADPAFVRLMFGFRKPKFRVLGADIAGRVEAVGNGVAGLRVGDEVFGDLAGSGWGAYAEYVCVPEGVVVPKPKNLTFEQAASLPLAAGTAVQGLRDVGKVRPGSKVLIIGASGGVGTLAVQIAKVLGAEVTGVCSTRNVEMVRSLGADRVVDYTREDVVAGGVQYNAIFSLAGHRSIFDYRRILASHGIFVNAGGENGPLYQAAFLAPFVSLAGDKKFAMCVAKPNRADLEYIRDLCEAGKLKPVIDRRYSLREVPDAIRYIETGRARGKVVITF